MFNSGIKIGTLETKTTMLNKKIIHRVTNKLSNRKKKNLHKKIKKTPENIKKRTVCLYMNFTKQNSIFTVTDINGNVKFTISNGSVGYHNSKSKTKYATQAAALATAKKIKKSKKRYIHYFVKGRNKGRKRIIRQFRRVYLFGLSFTEITSISHNGCRPTKVPRR